MGEGQRAGEQVLVGQQGQQPVSLGARGYSKIRQESKAFQRFRLGQVRILLSDRFITYLALGTFMDQIK